MWMRMRGVAGLRRSGREMAVLVLFVLVWFDDLRYTALRESSWEGRCMEHAGGGLAGMVGTVLAFLGEAVFNGNMPCFFCLWLKGWGLGGCIVGAGVGYGHGHRGCIPILRSRYLGGVDVGGSLISLHIYIHDLVQVWDFMMQRVPSTSDGRNGARTVGISFVHLATTRCPQDTYIDLVP